MNEKKKPHILPALIVFIIMAMISGIYALIFLMQHTPDKNRIIEGVYVDGINISGMTAEEAQAEMVEFDLSDITAHPEESSREDIIAAAEKAAFEEQ